jgi:hypothetical protein
MRKPLIAALGLVSLVSLAHAANYGIKDIGAKISFEVDMRLEWRSLYGLQWRGRVQVQVG